MCLIFFSYKSTPGYKLVLAANRDEFLDRPTAPLDFLDTNASILGGKDLQGGGTWLGIDKKQRFAALTNYRDPRSELTDLPSRGEIITNYLDGVKNSGEFLQGVVEKEASYNGFNLLIGDQEELYHYSNRGQGPTLLAPGFYGLSNHFLDTEWPKIRRGKRLLRSRMVDTENIRPESIFEILSDTHLPDDDQLPDTGVGLEWERLLSPIYIDSIGYGTRSSALVTIDDNDMIEFYEKTYLRQKGKEDSRLVYRNIN